MIIGIDPGKNGAFVLLSADRKVLKSMAMPLTSDESVSWVGVKQFLTDCLLLSPGCRVYLERAVSFGMGTKGAFNYGRSFATVELALIELCISYTFVEPRKWTKEIFQGIDQKLKPKVQADIAIRRIFPNEIEHIPTIGKKEPKLHEGFVDAMLIAEYGRRQSMLHS